MPRDLHRNARSAVGHVVREINEELCKAAFCGCVIAKDGGEGGIPEWFGKTLTQGLPGSAIVTQAENGQNECSSREMGITVALTEGSSAQRASVTSLSVAQQAV